MIYKFNSIPLLIKSFFLFFVFFRLFFYRNIVKWKSEIFVCRKSVISSHRVTDRKVTKKLVKKCTLFSTIQRMKFCCKFFNEVFSVSVSVCVTYITTSVIISNNLVLNSSHRKLKDLFFSLVSSPSPSFNSFSSMLMFTFLLFYFFFPYFCHTFQLFYFFSTFCYPFTLNLNSTFL